ncbi:hypothetical protein OG21DRAFT_1516203 [Imleria badia]|nr:hypothetical protein OG21DRAFT_1516203 [Imleria badia]
MHLSLVSGLAAQNCSAPTPEKAWRRLYRCAEVPFPRQKNSISVLIVAATRPSIKVDYSKCTMLPGKDTGTLLKLTRCCHDMREVCVQGLERVVMA